MYCPKCRGEYREDFTECSDCGVALVHEKPPEPEIIYDEFEMVMEVYNPAQISILKSLLDENKIKYYFHGEEFHRLYASAVESARLMVRKDQVEKVRNIIKDLDFVGSSGNGESEAT